MFTDKDLMRLHVEALFTCDTAGRLVAVNEPNGDAAPRFFFGRTAAGNAWWLRDDVDAALAGELDALCEVQPTGLEVEGDAATAAAPFIACLSRAAPVRKTWAGPAFRFPIDLPGSETTVVVTSDTAEVLTPYFEDWRRDISACAPVVVVLVERKAVSVCCSVRVTSQVHEAGVETHSDFRRRGHATRAVSAWAKAVREMGRRTPLYSTSWDNESSRALAKRLGLIQYGVDLHIT